MKYSRKEMEALTDLLMAMHEAWSAENMEDNEQKMNFPSYVYNKIHAIDREIFRKI